MHTPSAPALPHAIELMRRHSVTPEDGGCQDYLESVLAPLGFTRRHVDAGGVINSIYMRPGEKTGCLAYAGHTDVVPTGPLDAWPHPPFAAIVADGLLHGRGSQDMKASIACWVAAVEACIATGVPLPSLQALITSDEEGESVDGTVRLVEALQCDGALPDAAIVGEPSSLRQVGDTIRRGRRGVVQGSITFIGKQGHSAYPADADNAIHRALAPLARVAAIDWGDAAEGFPPTTCQITHIEGGTGATNVIPGRCRAILDIRYNPGIDYEGIQGRIASACAGTEVEIALQHQANAFSTPDGPLLELVVAGIRRVTGIDTCRDTGGGTSDGRFLAAAGVPVVELGLTNDTIHQIGERVRIDELDTLTRIYADIITHFEVPA
jgi:succinyl-diaminopimelate desuccinylase